MRRLYGRKIAALALVLGLGRRSRAAARRKAEGGEPHFRRHRPPPGPEGNPGLSNSTCISAGPRPQAASQAGRLATTTNGCACHRLRCLSSKVLESGRRGRSPRVRLQFRLLHLGHPHPRFQLIENRSTIVKAIVCILAAQGVRLIRPLQGVSRARANQPTGWRSG
jgi:hypothetical protein